MPQGKSFEIASGTTSVTVLTGQGTLVGYSVAEDAGVAAAATVIFRDGTTDTDAIVAIVELPADRSETQFLGDGVKLNKGLRVQRSAGSARGAVWLD